MHVQQNKDISKYIELRTRLTFKRRFKSCESVLGSPYIQLP